MSQNKDAVLEQSVVSLDNPATAVIYPRSGGGTLHIATSTLVNYHNVLNMYKLTKDHFPGFTFMWDTRPDFETFVRSGTAPGMVVTPDDNHIVVTFQGEAHGELWYSGWAWDTTWGGDYGRNTHIGQVTMSGSPSPTIPNVNDGIHIFHQGGGDNGSLWCCQLNPGSDKQLFPPDSIYGSPAALSGEDGNVYIMINSQGNGLECHLVEILGDIFIAIKLAGLGIPMRGSPAALFVGNRLYVSYQDSGGHLCMIYGEPMKGNWSEPVTYRPQSGSSVSDSLSILHCGWPSLVDEGDKNQVVFFARLSSNEFIACTNPSWH